MAARLALALKQSFWVAKVRATRKLNLYMFFVFKDAADQANCLGRIGVRDKNSVAIFRPCVDVRPHGLNSSQDRINKR